MRRSHLLPAFVAAAVGGVVPTTILGLASCSSSSAPSVLGGGQGVDTGASPYDGTTAFDDTGTPAADTGAADVGDSGAGPECGAGLSPCGILCVDLTSDPNSCGTCFNACSGSASGGGTIVSCCASKCVDNGSDPNNCRTCGVVCDSGSCVSGTCR
jgi:hypothetical protein